jgi:hypothetical protein
VQQEQRWSNRELRRTFDRPGNHPRGYWVVNRRRHRQLGRRSHLGLARARCGASRIAGELLLTTVVPTTRVVRLLGRMGGTDNIGIRLQVADVTKNKKQDQKGKHPTPGG